MAEISAYTYANMNLNALKGNWVICLLQALLLSVRS